MRSRLRWDLVLLALKRRRKKGQVNRSMHTRLRVLAWLVLIATASCGSEADTAAGDPGDPTHTCSGLGRSQSFSEPCCPDYGADACGAQLFCAAFDGRTQPSCYMEHSRDDMTGCTADVQCLSGSCSPSARKCSSTGKCAPTIGCAFGLACVKEQCLATSGELGAPCASPSDCRDGRTCVYSRCGGVLGEGCSGYDCGGRRPLLQVQERWEPTDLRAVLARAGG